MFHAVTLDASPAMQRAAGRVLLSAKLRGGRTVLDRLHQAGCAKARMPAAEGFEAVLLNTAGGLTGGDRIDVEIEAADGCHVTAASQTAERVYRSLDGAATVWNRLRIGAGARVDWLPQETILFDGGRLDRRLDVEMAEDATLLAVEPLILGRAAMGERVETGGLIDNWRVRRGGRLLHAEALRFSPEAGAAPVGFAGRLAAATLLYVAPDAEDRLASARAALPEDVTGGVSAWGGRLVARILAETGRALRAALIPLIRFFRAGALPRVWSI